jgi:hypothetical protein
MRVKPVIMTTKLERQLMANATRPVCDMANTIKSVFADTGGATVVAVSDKPIRPKVAPQMRVFRRKGARGA